MQYDFKEKYYHHFTDEEENKLIYMDIFREYVSCFCSFDEHHRLKYWPGLFSVLFL